MISACGGTSQVEPHEIDVPFSFVERLQLGDRNLGWALTYYDSWNRNFEPRYLQLAEKHLVDAIEKFSLLQADTSPRIREFYAVQDRRVRSCRLLVEFHSTASQHGHQLINSSKNHCVFY